MRVFPVAGRLSLLLIVATAASSAAQDDFDEDFPPGLLARYTAAGKTIERVDADVAFVWGDEAPDPRLPAAAGPDGRFEATWEGLLLVRQPGEYRFEVFLGGGEAAVEIDGKRVLSGSRDAPGWVVGEAVTLEFGEKPLKVTYKRQSRSRGVRADAPRGGSTGAPAQSPGTPGSDGASAQSLDAPYGGAQLRLFWSSDSFPLEPVPAHLLFRDGGRPDLDRLERGRVLFEAHRCGRCHVRENAPPAPAAPSLVHVAAGTSREWLVEKVQAARFRSQAGAWERDAPGRMPHFGFDRQEAEAVAAFLVHGSQDVKLASPGRSRDEAQDRRQGEVLFRSLGCLACHRVGNVGTDGPYGGGDLSDSGAKRSPEWLATWLAEPQKLNADHRMPTFELSANERRQLALYLSSLGADDTEGEPGPGPEAKSGAADKAGDKDLVDAGRRLVESARCAACHRIPGVEPDVRGLRDLSQAVDDWSKSCLSETPGRSAQRPAYSSLGSDEIEALKAYLAAHAGPLSAESRFDRGRHLLERRNCLACHERDTAKGIAGLAARVARLDEALQGQSQGLVAPALTAVGDKLLDEALGRAVSGEQPKRRLPWLAVRMPRFEHSPDDRQALVEYLIGHDRIPDADDAFRAVRAVREQSGAAASAARAEHADSPNEPIPADDSQLLIAGHTLVGAKGFSCVACHQLGEFLPRNVALGTRGSDLVALGGHMRESYFLRWTRSPMRIVPGMEMPSIVKPAPGVLDETIDTQLDAIWKALNDPRFTPPTDPGSVEQYLVVRPGEPPRVIRDVFTNPKENGGGTVARALAIGFPNGHSVLYDLDTLTVRGWFFGDFARQRTAGKSWYWDMAGVPVIAGLDGTSDYALRPTSSTEQAGGGNGETSNAPLVAPTVRDGTGGRLVRYRTDRDRVRVEYELDFELRGELRNVRMIETLRPLTGDDGRSGWVRRIAAPDVPAGYELLVSVPDAASGLGEAAVRSGNDAEAVSAPMRRVALRPSEGGSRAAVAELRYDAALEQPEAEVPQKPPLFAQPGPITTVPGFDGVRLPLDTSIMPTSIAWTAEGTLAFTSLKGHVFLARDTDGDGIEDALSVFEEGLAAPYGLLADEGGLLVAHKPEVLRLRDTTGDGRADRREVVATGWGYTDDYHDWTTGFARDGRGNLYIGTGSDYAQRQRPRENSKWRGKVLKVAPDGTITPVAHAFRYPMGLAMNAAGDLFVTDNQGVQNTFNEINHIVPGGHYGVPGRWERDEDVTHLPPAIQVPHPWSRSVNGITFLPASTHPQLAGHLIGAEYDTRFLVRFTLEKVGDVYQGAAYYSSRPGAGAGGENFSGPLCVAAAPNGDLFVGSIHDSGWLGGQNTGELVRLRSTGDLPNGIRELRVTADGFDIEFFHPIDPEAAARPESYTISGYTRVWGGAYATPDSGRHRLDVSAVNISDDHRTVRLTTPGRRTGHVYEVTCSAIGTTNQRELWPATAHYTLHRIPGH